MTFSYRRIDRMMLEAQMRVDKIMREFRKMMVEGREGEYGLPESTEDADEGEGAWEEQELV